MLSAKPLAGRLARYFAWAAMATLFWTLGLPSANAQIRDRVLAPVDSAHTVAMSGHRPTWAISQADIGAVPGDLRLQNLTVVLARSPELQQAFEDFLQSQQNPVSPDYHHWLTPIEIGLRFGVSQHDIDAVSDWLRSHGFQVDSVANSRVSIIFSGPASAVASAFGSEMHYFSANGQKRISLVAEPEIPTALAPVIRGIHGLHTSLLRPAHRMGTPRQFTFQKSLASGSTPTPAFTAGSSHFIAPGDFAEIYDVPNSVSGTGQTIAILGRSRVWNPDIENFQTLTGLAVKDPTVIIPPSGIDPGPASGTAGESGDQDEQTLDVTRSGSIAPGATVDLIVSADTATAFGVDVALQYLVNTSPVPAHIASISYSGCEADNGQAAANFYDNLFSIGAGAGVSFFVSSGDAGAAGCDPFFQTPPASQIASPNVLCASSYVTCVGGTEFNDTNANWNASNGANLESAIGGYISEGGWNEPSCGTGCFQAAGSGGGVSAFIKTPIWQTGTGVPAARTGRYTPDVAFSSAEHDGYFGCLAAIGASCVVSGGGFPFAIFAGTSAAAPDMAGVAALLNQKIGSPQGNLNPTLYKLAGTAPTAFHDVTVASSGVAGCTVNVPSLCNNSTPSPTGLMGGQAGFLLTAGYDEVTGLGSLDVANLLNNWANGANGFGSTSTTVIASANPITTGTSETFTSTVTTTGPNPATGSVSFLDGSTTLGSGNLSTVSGSQVATFTTSSLSLGQHSITASYGGDANNTGSTSSAITVSVLSSNPVPILALLSPSSANAGSGALVLGVTGANFMPTSQVLWNGTALTTTYISGGTQLQAAVPAGNVAAGGTATVTVKNPVPGGGTSNGLTFDVLENFAGTGGFLSMFVNGANLGNSVLFQGTCPATGLPCVGVGNTAPIRTLDVSGEIQARGGNLFLQRNLTDLAGRRNWAWGTETANVGDMAFFVSTGNSNFPSQNVMTLLSNGNVGIGPVATTPLTTLQVGGDIRMGTTGTNGCLQNFAGTALAGTCSSDARLKSNILPFAPVLDKVVQLQPVHFQWKSEEYPDYHFGAGRNSGLLAQDVEKVFPEMVSVDSRGFKAVNYSELPYLTLAAIRELKTENDALRTQLAERQQELQKLQHEVASVQARLAKLEKPASRAAGKKTTVQPKPAAKKAQP